MGIEESELKTLRKGIQELGDSVDLLKRYKPKDPRIKITEDELNRTYLKFSDVIDNVCLRSRQRQPPQLSDNRRFLIRELHELLLRAGDPESIEAKALELATDFDDVEKRRGEGGADSWKPSENFKQIEDAEGMLLISLFIHYMES